MPMLQIPWAFDAVVLIPLVFEVCDGDVVYMACCIDTRRSNRTFTPSSAKSSNNKRRKQWSPPRRTEGNSSSVNSQASSTSSSGSNPPPARATSGPEGVRGRPLSEVICYNCSAAGHYSNDCPQPFNPRRQARLRRLASRQENGLLNSDFRDLFREDKE